MLDATSHLARVNYYGCQRCGLVWNQPKTDDQIGLMTSLLGRPTD
jgi:hypothetical protein